MSALEVIELTQQLERRDARIIELEKVIYAAYRLYRTEEGAHASSETEKLWNDLGLALASIDLDFDLEKTS